MLTAFIITFREVFEIALILGSVIGYLEKTNQPQFKRGVYSALGLALVVSFLAALEMRGLFTAYHTTANLLFAGLTLVAGALFIVGMLWWQWRAHKNQSVTEKIAKFVEKEERVGLFLFVFLSVARDIMEIVVFLSAAGVTATALNIVGALGGIAAAALAGFILLSGIRRLPVKNIFRFTTIFLLLLAASLLIQGFHELSEAGVLGMWMKGVS